MIISSNVTHYGRNLQNSRVSSRVTVKVRRHGKEEETKTPAMGYTGKSLSLSLVLEEPHINYVTLANHCIFLGISSIKRLELENF